eukprot:COSAG04_NODE_4184_length_2248_cov_2.823174_3_plen_114_part_00
MFSSFVVKVANAETEGAATTLISEAEALAKLSHINVVHILGMIHGPSPQDARSAYMTCLEYAESSLKQMLYKVQLQNAVGKTETWAKDQAQAYSDYSIELMVDLAEQIACGLA